MNKMIISHCYFTYMVERNDNWIALLLNHMTYILLIAHVRLMPRLNLNFELVFHVFILEEGKDTRWGQSTNILLCVHSDYIMVCALISIHKHLQQYVSASCTHTHTANV